MEIDVIISILTNNYVVVVIVASLILIILPRLRFVFYLLYPNNFTDVGPHCVDDIFGKSILRRVRGPCVPSPVWIKEMRFSVIAHHQNLFDTLIAIRHPNLLKMDLLSSKPFDRCITMVVSYPNLYEAVNENPFSKHDMELVALDLCSGLKKLHELNLFDL
jgi:hypothetical protein